MASPSELWVRRLARFGMSFFFDLLALNGRDCEDMDPDSDFFGVSPSHQNAVDLFKGEWASVFPPSAGVETGGFAGTFEDERITWAAKRLGGFEGCSVLELGPLEGGHSFVLERLGVASVLAIEVSPQAFLRCLVAKEIMDLRRSTFLLGDFTEFVRKSGQRFDLCLASGVLYHMMDPVGLLRSLARRCRKLFLWTHYFEAEAIGRRDEVKRRFGPLQRVEEDGVAYELAPYSYGTDTSTKAFCGGQAIGSRWMEEASLFRALEAYGFRVVDARREDHPNGPAVWIAADRDD